MSSNVPINSPFLRSSRNFPEDLHQLTVEVNKAYVDTATRMNERTIGVFPTNRPLINGEAWFVSGNHKQQGLRQIYTFTAAGNVAHGLNFAGIAKFTKCSGSYTDGTNWYGALYGSNVAIAGQISFYITSTNIVILAGAGAPTISATNPGVIVLEWISQP